MHRFCSLFVLVGLASSQCVAAALEFTPFKPGGIYALGEKAGWTVVAPADVSGTYTYTIKKNNWEVIDSGTLDLSRRATIEATLNEPAMLYVEVDDGDEATPIHALGAASGVRASLAAHAPYSVAPAVLRAMRLAMDLFVQMKAPLEDIKALAGSPPAALTMLQQSVAQILGLASVVVPPDELAAAHALLVSAAQMAGNAADIRWQAVLATDMSRAWDASSAAAGALMLSARARADIQSQMRFPQLK